MQRFTLLLIITNLISLIATLCFVLWIYGFVVWKPSLVDNDKEFRRRLRQGNCCSCTFNLEGRQGALVTSDCQFQNDYDYAIDILLSCGSERWNAPLRLHTFKRHSYNHQKIFNDQLLTFRQGNLWFDAYDQPRCIQIRSDGDLHLTQDASDCTEIEFVPTTIENGYGIRDAGTNLCVALDAASCGSDRSTGGRECGGMDHRYLPLGMKRCDDEASLMFRFEITAEDCSNGAAKEFPSTRCFSFN
eukprot:CAMPEP_0178897040 /NCGR_PEP_ID=MMETSP0786-20121207/1520_1 /TAXON_ID=186022 /ORGANISM="Thalassionema frauenfeldii, Strain CCMP 1798" /LENGTH=244 /DNA_ID=CAMNT_0020567535 /DNA_START=1 /DNA_END=735 /DNA_ORIENTATION=-